VKRECGYEKFKVAGIGLNRIESIMDGITLIMPTKLKCKISAQAKSLIEMAACAPSVTPGSRMFDGPSKFLCFLIRFNERKSYDQETQGKTYVGKLSTYKNQSNSTLAPFEHVMQRQTNIRFSFKLVTQWNGNWSKFAKHGVKERIGNNCRR